MSAGTDLELGTPAGYIRAQRRAGIIVAGAAATSSLIIEVGCALAVLPPHLRSVDRGRISVAGTACHSAKAKPWARSVCGEEFPGLQTGRTI
jgi:hypothetical protein